jgi:DNA-binding Lrp family transcriptional regulator
VAGRGPNLPNVESVEDLDQLDLEIVAVLGVKPDSTFRDIANKTGRDLHTVFSRVRRLRRSDWVEDMREALRNLDEKFIAAINDGATLGEPKDRAGVAGRMLSGLGVLEDKRRVELKLDDATPEQIKSALSKLSDDDLRDIITKRNAG